jgi:hypothetical protein
MKRVLTLLSIAFFFSGLVAQNWKIQLLEDVPLFVEVVDTTEIAYVFSYLGFEKDGISIRPKTVKDSIGLDTILLFRFYVYDSSECDAHKKTNERRNPNGFANGFCTCRQRKRYLPYTLKEYITEPKGRDERFSTYGW